MFLSGSMLKTFLTRWLDFTLDFDQHEEVLSSCCGRSWDSGLFQDLILSKQEEFCCEERSVAFWWGLQASQTLQFSAPQIDTPFWCKGIWAKHSSTQKVFVLNGCGKKLPCLTITACSRNACRDRERTTAFLWIRRCDKMSLHMHFCGRDEQTRAVLHDRHVPAGRALDLRGLCFREMYRTCTKRQENASLLEPLEESSKQGRERELRLCIDNWWLWRECSVSLLAVQMHYMCLLTSEPNKSLCVLFFCFELHH